MLNETGPMAETSPRWWVEEYTAVPDPIEADTDYCFDTAAEAAEHGEPWAVIEHPAAYTSGPVSPGYFIVAGHRSDAIYYLASLNPIRDEDRRTWFWFY
ncbi:hypothetical protein [Sinomonas humi]|uniref:Uncharacterized protein n=1 Tax=Sinomonas humi TaxID=1338436 RepID=A0A0B2AJH2_9MICC|nr:hypothetical protein [Sinomonas humi]KHL03800.1 hypothetical protein LK10_08415 [Sinomonas humi]